MRISDKAIVLQAIKYGDKKFILKLFTRQQGLVTVSCITGNSPSSKIRSGSVLPLSLIDTEIITKQNKEVQQLTEASCYYINTSISTSLSKLTIAQFINEVLIKSLKENSGNKTLFDFVEGCLKYLNESEEFVNLHIYFLIELTKYLGIEPSDNFSLQEPFFDCREGRFTSYNLAFPLGLDKDESFLFSETLKINCLEKTLSNLQRSRLLSILIAYYQFHVPGFNQLRSLDVLKEVVSA